MQPHKLRSITRRSLLIGSPFTGSRFIDSLFTLAGVVSAVGVLFASACAQPPHEAGVGVSSAQVSQPMVYGREDTSERFDAVVKLNFKPANTFCSGTLIAPDTVLTAAHCIPPEWHVGDGVQRLSDEQQVEVVFHRGPRQRALRAASAVAVHERYRGLQLCSHSGADDVRRACRAYADRCGGLVEHEADACLSKLDRHVRHGLGLDKLWPTHDVALVFLSVPVFGVSAVHITDERCCDGLVRAHAPVVLAGYGQQKNTRSDPGGAGVILHGHNHIVEAGNGELRVDGGDKTHPCFGDSGGPLFAEVDHDEEHRLVQVGIASRIWDYHVHRGCASGLAYTRIDHEGAFIGATMRDALVEGVRHPQDAAADPQFTLPPPGADSCRQTPVPWGCALLLGLWLHARRLHARRLHARRALHV